MQEGMLFHTLDQPDSWVYVSQFSCQLRPLEPVLLLRAWNKVMARHQLLRAGFVWEGLDRPVQVIGREVALPSSSEDWRGVPGPQRSARLEALLVSDRHRGFQLSKAPLMRLSLIRLDNDEYQLIYTHHHIILDGWSFYLVLSEVLTLYEAFVKDREAVLPEPKPYRDFVRWLHHRCDPAL